MDHSNLYIQRSGPEGAPAIVFLHGGGVGGWMWRAQVERLNRQYRCLVPDLPGQANSKTAGPFSHARAADMVVELIQREALGGKAHVVGLSEGAQCAVELLSRAPEVVDHALISSALLRPMPALWMYSRGVLAWSYRLFMAPLNRSDWWIRLNMQKSAGLPEEYYPQFKHSFQETNEEEFVEPMYAGLHYRMPKGIEKATSRVLVVVGNKEYRQMHDSARDLVRILPNAHGVVVSLGPNARLPEEHNWAVTAPDLFSRTLQAWIESAPLPKELLDLEKSDR